VSVYSDRILAEASLQLYWRLGETAGTSAADSKGTRSGTYTQAAGGGYTLGQTGALANDADKAVLLTRANGGYVKGPSALPGQTAARSLECWVKADFNVTFGNIMGDQAGNSGWFLYCYSAGLIFGAYANGGFRSVATAMLTNAWHHVVGTWDGLRTLTLYVDGAQVAQYVHGADLVPVASTSPLDAGRSSNGTNYLNGTIDEVAVYTGALTAAKVLDHYQVGSSSGTCVQAVAPTGLEAVSDAATVVQVVVPTSSEALGDASTATAGSVPTGLESLVDAQAGVLGVAPSGGDALGDQATGQVAVASTGSEVLADVSTSSASILPAADEALLDDAASSLVITAAAAEALADTQQVGFALTQDADVALADAQSVSFVLAAAADDALAVTQVASFLLTQDADVALIAQAVQVLSVALDSDEVLVVSGDELLAITSTGVELLVDSAAVTLALELAADETFIADGRLGIMLAPRGDDSIGAGDVLIFEIRPSGPRFLFRMIEVAGSAGRQVDPRGGVGAAEGGSPRGSAVEIASGVSGVG
jgi:hypothetical protein